MVLVPRVDRARPVPLASSEERFPAELGAELLRVARRALRAHFELEASAGERVTPAALPKLPVFVTLRARGGVLRGCIGSLHSREDDVALETARVAILAATCDPRFEPLIAAELEQVTIEVSVVLPEVELADVRELDSRRHGVVVRDASGRQGVLLPGVPGVTGAAEQIALARRKAGIDPRASVTIGRFGVAKFAE